MCGIVGAIRANHNVVDFLTDGLKRLEYRGYDSSGIAVNMDGKIKRVRRVGRVTLGNKVTTGAGSAITKNVEDGKLVLARSRQTVIEGWVRPEKGDKK